MKKEIELKRMMIVANSFFNISENCKKNSCINAYDMIAITANYAFSIEVSLKFLYYDIYNKKLNKIHNIKYLYSKVKQCGLESYLLKFIPRSNIHKIIRELKSAFVDFRYLYEKNKTYTITPSLMRYFAILINQFCNKYLERIN